MTSSWPPSLGPGDMGGIRPVAELPGRDALAALDPYVVRSATLAGHESKRAFLDALAGSLAFPAWFGRNWDALEELLRAPEPEDDRAIVVVWHDPDRLPSPERDAAEAAFVSAAEWRRASGMRPLVVLVPARHDRQRGDSERSQDKEPMSTPEPDRLPANLRGIGRIHHVAIVVRSIDEALRVWRDLLGLRVETIMDIAQDRVRIAFLEAGQSKIELVEPTDDTTGVARFLASRGEGFHHVCLEVEDLAGVLARLAADGAELIDTAPRRGAEGPVAFIHPRSCNGALVELIEAPGGPAWQALGFETA